MALMSCLCFVSIMFGIVHDVSSASRANRTESEQGFSSNFVRLGIPTRKHNFPGHVTIDVPMRKIKEGLSDNQINVRQNVVPAKKNHVVIGGSRSKKLSDKISQTSKNKHYIYRNSGAPGNQNNIVNSTGTPNIEHFPHNITICVECNDFFKDLKEKIIESDPINKISDDFSHILCSTLASSKQACIVFVHQYVEEVANRIANTINAQSICISLGFCRLPPPPMEVNRVV